MKKFIAVFCIMLLAVFTFAACSSKKEGTKEQTQNIRIGEVTHSLFYAPLYVGIKKGFFKDEGLNIDLQTTAGGDKTMTALLSGGIDIALVGSETSIYVHQQGAKDPIINFAQLTQTDGTFLVSRKKLDSFNWNDVKDVTFLGQRKGGMPQMVGEYVLKKNGIDPHKDTNLIQNIEFANIASAFASGTGEFVQLFEPTASIFEKEGKGFIVASFGNESGTVPYTTFMAKESFLKKDKDAAEKFTRALYKAQQWVDTHSPEEIADTVSPLFKDTSKDITVKVIERYKKQHSYATNPLLDAEEWKQLQTIMKEAGELQKEVPHEALVNTKIAESVIKK
ncbi:ABC transporter substrate-binding protein [Bacillus wiedmannii]|uniref:ABC transporter substrate-binding protein n=1 Tax=Bacillus cereus group TaxID=86661 RepID=UPI0011EBB5C0|nr:MULTISPECIES: ABC transporter substrate-binding protein [Bacillus cereus group]KAA0789798.1 ABC transporter substrate-binding protein [Bacillus sp. BB081]QWH74492.1 ABC transporter substrate-binding protein [Bacillus wiedmannii]